MSEKDSAVVSLRPGDRGRLVFLVQFATLLDYYAKNLIVVRKNFVSKNFRL